MILLGSFVSLIVFVFLTARWFDKRYIAEVRKQETFFRENGKAGLSWEFFVKNTISWSACSGTVYRKMDANVDFWFEAWWYVWIPILSVIPPHTDYSFAIGAVLIGLTSIVFYCRAIRKDYFFSKLEMISAPFVLEDRESLVLKKTGEFLQINEDVLNKLVCLAEEMEKKHGREYTLHFMTGVLTCWY